MLIKKKSIKVIISIIAVLLIIAIIALIVGVVLPNVKRNQIKNKLSQINAEDLQEKMIQEIEKTELNINTEKLSTTIGTFEMAEKSNETKNIDKLFANAELYYALTGNTNDFKNYVFAYIIGEDNELVIIPCFKIESDSNGNFKSIKCKWSKISHKVTNIFLDVLEKDYGIKLEGKYKAELQKSNKDNVTIYSSSDNNLFNISKEYLNMYGTGSISQQVQSLKEESKSMTVFEIDN